MGYSVEKEEINRNIFKTIIRTVQRRGKRDNPAFYGTQNIGTSVPNIHGRFHTPEFHDIPTNSLVSNNQLPTDSRGPHTKRSSFSLHKERLKRTLSTILQSCVT
jgi:hypothetical protein